MSESLAIAEWRRAEDCRQVARLCLRHGFHADAIARSYYAVLHASKAALALQGVRPRRHRALSNLFGQHIVMTGLVEGRWGSIIGRLADLRWAADYACQQADACAERIHALLTDTITPERLQPPTN